MEAVTNMIMSFLAEYKNSKISILELAKPFPNVNYEQFAAEILQLQQTRVLTPIKSSGTNGKQPPLANVYKINKTVTRQSVRERVIALKKSLHPAIFIEYYLTKTIDELEQDFTALQQLNTYIQTHGFPSSKALAQERSFEIFHDEKWIIENGGKQFLEKVKVWDLLEIWPIADPVSFAINPLQLQQNEHHKFLIVENKATFYSLLPALTETDFTALLYGKGYAILSTLQVLPTQLPLNYEQAQFYYFGDIDADGISIWHSLNYKQRIKLAYPFYKACIEKEQALGKEYQRKSEQAIQHFCENFSAEEQQKIKAALQNGCYYPQEILKAEELQQIWRYADWT